MASEDTEAGDSCELQDISPPQIPPIEDASTDGSVVSSAAHPDLARTLEIRTGPEILDLSPLPPLPSSPIEPSSSDSDAFPEISLTKPRRALIWATLEIISSRFLGCDRTILVQGWCTLRRLCNGKSELVLKVATILALLITGISMWPSILGALDSHKSELIAEWTARKDFFQICEANNWTSNACEEHKGIELDAPPNLDRNEWRRSLGTGHSSFVMTKTRGAISHPWLWVPVSACLLLVLGRRFVHISKGFCSKSSTSPVHTIDLESVYHETEPDSRTRTHDTTPPPAHREASHVPETTVEQDTALGTTQEQGSIPQPIPEQASLLEPPPEQHSAPEPPIEQDSVPETPSEHDQLLGTALKDDPVLEITLGQHPVLETLLEQNSVLQTTLEQNPALKYRKIPCWHCCLCGRGPMTVALNDYCLCLYQHERCANCRVEYLKPRRLKEE